MAACFRAPFMLHCGREHATHRAAQGDEEPPRKRLSAIVRLNDSSDKKPGSGSRREPKPRICLLADRPGWVFDAVASGLGKSLADEFEFRIAYVCQRPDLSAWPFDLIYVFFWGETYHQAFVHDPRQVIKEISSHRWGLEDCYGRLSPAQAAERYLSDAATLTTTSRRLQSLFAPHREVLWTPNGFDPELFSFRRPRRGRLRIGWAGNERDPCKGLNDILRPAAGGDLELLVAGGNLDRAEMVDFYNSVDVLCVASTAEGQPLTLVEGMACGCYPVCVDVGIVPELVRHRENGLIIARTVAAFRAAFQWCSMNLERAREAGQQNAGEMLRQRTWAAVAPTARNALNQALEKRCRTGVTPLRPMNSDPPNPSDNPHGHVISGAKARYHEHFARMNPAGASDETYRACLVYYEAELRPLLPADRNARILDLGCGHGHLIRFIAEAGYVRVGGVELDADLCRGAHAYLGDKAEFLIEGDAFEYLAKQREAFDFISAFDVIEHFTLDEAAALARLIYQALRADGVAAFRTPNMANVLGIYSRYIDLTHQTAFTEFSLAQLLREAGFAGSRLHLPEWDPRHPLTPQFKQNAEFHRTLFALQDRATPTCFEKNIVVVARKALP